MTAFTPTTASRLLSAPASPHGVAMGYLWDSGAAIPNGPTGNWRPVTVADFQPAATTANNFVPSGGAAQTLVTGLALAANAYRTDCFVQNVGTGSVLYVKLGPAPASQQNFSLILAAATTDFGPGGSFTSQTWKGPISVSGQTRGIWWETQ